MLVEQTEVKDGAISNPREYYTCIQRMFSMMLGIVTYQNLNRNLTDSVPQLFEGLQDSLSSNCLFVEKFKESGTRQQEALNGFYNWYLVQEFGDVNLSDLYELMLGLEFPIKDGVITEDHDGQILDTIGSFYTPSNLADKIVQLTLDNYILENTGFERFSNSEKTKEQMEQVSALLAESSFADHCCGTGSFLLAILKYVEEHLNVSHIQEQIALNFEAIEADAIALEVAKIQMLTYLDRLDLYAKLDEKFIHGNPILRPVSGDFSHAYSDEFYYHNGLAMHPSSLKRCDVIVGNPPWGEIGFDLAFFCHIILPQVNEIESQEELDDLLGGLEASHPQLFEWLLEHEEAHDQAVDQIYEDERFQNSTKGGLHTNVIFTELLSQLSTKRGSVGLVLKGSTLTDKNNAGLLKALNSEQRIIGRYDFKNTNRLFNIDSDEHFSILILGNAKHVKPQYQQQLTSLNQLIN